MRAVYLLNTRMNAPEPVLEISVESVVRPGALSAFLEICVRNGTLDSPLESEDPPVSCSPGLM